MLRYFMVVKGEGGVEVWRGCGAGTLRGAQCEATRWMGRSSGTDLLLMEAGESRMTLVASKVLGIGGRARWTVYEWPLEP